MDKPKAYLKNVNVKYISLVNKAANKMQFLYKSADGANTPDIHLQVAIRKSDDAKRLVYGVVYAPDVIDAHGHAMTAEEIEKAAHAFMQKSTTDAVDVEHDESGDDGHIVESFIIEKADDRYPDAPAGSWAVALKISDDDTWSKIEKGELTGISMGAMAIIEDVETETEKAETLIMKFADKLKNIFNPSGPVEVKKDFESRMQLDKLHFSINALTSELDHLRWNNSLSAQEKKDQALTTVEQFTSYVSEMDLSEASPITKDEKMSDTKKDESAETVKKSAEGASEKQETDTNETLEQKIEKAVKAETTPLLDEIEQLKTKLSDVEKRAPGRQSSEGSDPVNKSDYNPKAPLRFS